MAARTWQGDAQGVCVGTTRAPPLLLRGQVSISKCPSVRPSIRVHVCV